MELLGSGYGSESWWFEWLRDGWMVVLEEVLWWRGSSESSEPSEPESEVVDEAEEVETVLGLRGRR